MAVFKCKMCGANLEISEGLTVVTCDYCGTQQTLPKLNDEKRVQLYDRANYFRRENEFDKAMGIYEMILGDDKEDCECYWGIVLCRYGIEYVEDPRSHKRIPTVNRAQFTSIFDDDDYKNAIRYADALQKEVYEAEASVIDKIQKGILAISQKEEPFDVFICYKETDSNGNRTQDSVYAQDIYTTLTKEGYKVFFSRITLEDKLGSAYEPYIFAALNTAKVMLVVGTHKDNFNAVWVKNEWSRFIALIKAGKEKTLIPVYKEISPYDMPEEFQYLQSQDMGKIGFMQDLVRGVAKLVGSSVLKPKETNIVNSRSSDVSALLKRAFMFLEDGDFDRADDFCEQVLNIDPENAQAYLGKLLAECRVKKLEDLQNYPEGFSKSVNYSKIQRFGDEQLKTALEDCLKAIDERITIEQEQRLEAERKEKEALEKEKKRKKKRRKNLSVVFSIIAVVIAFSILLTTVIIPKFRFSDIIAVSAGGNYTVGLKSDGTVVAVGYNGNGRCDVDSWTDIIAVSAGDDHTVGLKSDGTVVAVGSDGNGQCDVDSWTDIIAVSVGNDHTVGVKSDGTVVAVGYNGNGRCEVDDWTDIIAVSAGDYHTVGVKSDGTVVAVGYNDSGQCDVDGWTDIIAVSAGGGHTVGLKSDGTVVAVGYNDHGRCDVDGWTDIIAVSAGDYHTVGLKSDGTVVAVGYNDYGQCDVDSWTDIIAVSAGWRYTVGLKSDGTVVAVGMNFDGQCLVGGSK